MYEYPERFYWYLDNYPNKSTNKQIIRYRTSIYLYHSFNNGGYIEKEKLVPGTGTTYPAVNTTG
jgi:hypothetical protein